MRNARGGEKLVNINKLRGKITERGLNIEYIAKEIGIDRSTMYRKLEDSGEKITIKEASIISTILCLTPNEVNSIFFDDTVA